MERDESGKTGFFPEQWEDEGWAGMNNLLDQHMPVRKKRRVVGWWFWGIGLLLIAGIATTGHLASKAPGKTIAQKTKPVEEKTVNKKSITTEKAEKENSSLDENTTDELTVSKEAIQNTIQVEKDQETVPVLDVKEEKRLDNESKKLIPLAPSLDRMPVDEESLLIPQQTPSDSLEEASAEQPIALTTKLPRERSQLSEVVLNRLSTNLLPEPVLKLPDFVQDPLPGNKNQHAVRAGMFVHARIGVQDLSGVDFGIRLDQQASRRFGWSVETGLGYYRPATSFFNRSAQDELNSVPEEVFSMADTMDVTATPTSFFRGYVDLNALWALRLTTAFEYKPHRKITLFGGPDFSYVIANDLSGDLNANFFSPASGALDGRELADFVNKLQFGLTGGMTYEPTRRLGLTLRYQHGFGKLLDSDENIYSPVYRTSGAVLGMQFRFGGK